MCPGLLNHFNPLWQMASSVLSIDKTYTISLNHSDTITAIMRLLSYALVFWLTLNYCQDRNKAKTVFFGLMISGFLYSIYGLIIHLGSFKTILWQESFYHGSLTSTFVNRNHFATYAGLTLICSLALLSNGIQSSSKYKLGGYLGWQHFLENLINRNWFPLLAFFAIGTALILTHSPWWFFEHAIGYCHFICRL